MKIKSKILIIAGSDSSGGAGIQADIKTVTALGSYAMTAITAVTAQNTTGVKSIIPIKPKEISNEIPNENYGRAIRRCGFENLIQSFSQVSVLFLLKNTTDQLCRHNEISMYLCLI